MDAALATYLVSSQRVYLSQRFVNRNWLCVLWSWFILHSVSWDLSLSSQVDHFKRRPVLALPSDFLWIIRILILHWF